MWACVRLEIIHTYRLDSFGSCSDSDATCFAATLDPSLATSKRTRLAPVCGRANNVVCELALLILKYVYLC
jgi:hypothetical protein